MTQKPNITWIGSPNFGYPRGTHGRNGYSVIAIVDHIMAGTLEGTDAWFRNEESDASAHFGVGKNGEIHQYVDLADAAWHAGEVHNPAWDYLIKRVNPNYYTVGIEHEGYPEDIMPEAQYLATLALHRWLVQEFGIAVSPNTIIGHYRIDSVNKPNCPGRNFPWGRLLNDLKREEGIFPDVPADHWAAGSVERVAKAGLMHGYPNGYFKGGQYVTRYELASVLDRMLNKIEP